MIKFFLLLLLPLTSLFAAKILSYNIYDRSDRVDVMITFDTPYKGTIREAKNSSNIIIKLGDASIESSKIKKISSAYINSLAITPLKNYTQIVAAINTKTRLIASKTSDGYGLRLRFTNKASTTKTTNQTANKVDNYSLSSLPTKKDIAPSISYYVVVSLLIIGIVIALILKKRIVKKEPLKKQPKNSWLFQENEQKTAAKASPTATKDDATVSIRFQKKLDDTNSVVMLDFDAQSYLVLMGNGNILLDKFIDDKPATQEDFESILKSRQEELEEYLQIDSQTASTKEPLQAYKERAGSLAYNEFI